MYIFPFFVNMDETAVHDKSKSKAIVHEVGVRSVTIKCSECRN